MKSFTLIWKLVYRNWIFWISLIAAIIHLCFLFHQYFYDDYSFNIGNGLVMSSFVVQGGILIFMFFGIYLQNVEREIRIERHLKTIGVNFFSSVTIGKFIFVCIFIFILSVFAFFLFAAMILNRGLPIGSFFLDSFLYILLYWGATFLISFLVGTLLSIWIQSKAVYALAIFLSILFGPLNYIFGNFQILDFINLGQPDYSYSYHSLYGYPLEWYYLLKKWILLTGLLIIILTSVIIKQKKLYPKSTLFLALMTIKLIVLSYSYLSTDHPIRFTYDSKSPVYQEFSYYQESKALLEQQDLIAESYDIDLSLSPLSVSVDMVIKNNGNQPLETIHLSLYRQLNVTSISVDNEQIPFKQESDFMTIYPNRELLSKESITLHIVYSGESSPFYMVNSQAVYLPAHFH
jgi:hypothetical protein